MRHYPKRNFRVLPDNDNPRPFFLRGLRDDMPSTPLWTCIDLMGQLVGVAVIVAAIVFLAIGLAP